MPSYKNKADADWVFNPDFEVAKAYMAQIEHT